LFLRAYGKIYRNTGATTEGVTEETVDGMSLRKVHRIIDLLRQERYRWAPVRRTEIPKANGKMRPLGIPTWGDKLVKRLYGRCWSRTTNRSSATVPTDSGPTGVATRRSARSEATGRAPPGSSRETSRVASTTSTMRSCWRPSGETSTTAGWCG